MAANSQLTPAKFKQIGDRCGTDKTLQHGYHRFYPAHLAPLSQLKDFGILEIGYGEGSSISLWRALYPQAFVYCFDRDVEDEGEGHRVIKADQSSPESLSLAIAKIEHEVHLIVDDGSHNPAHQLQTFSHLFSSLLAPHGVYIVEDIETSYWLDGELYGYATHYGLFNHWSAIEAFKLIVDYSNRSFLAPCDQSQLEYRLAMVGLDPQASALVSSVTFAQNFIVLSKADAGDMAYYDRPYVYGERIQRSP